MNSSELASLISSNRDSIAFLIGNGIHNYETYEKKIEGKFDWNRLIAKVQEDLSPLLNHVNYTQLDRFDAIVRENTKNIMEKRILEMSHLKSLIDHYSKYVGANEECVRQIECSENKVYNPTNLLYVENKRLQQAEKIIIQRIQYILCSCGISFNPMSYDFQAMAQHIVTNGSTNDYVAKEIVKGVFSNYTLQEWVVPFLKVAYSIQAPILTTNYDTALSKLLRMKQRRTVETKQIQTGFPFETYFAPTRITNPWDSFAIWHIHGLYFYVNSIRIGKNDYDNLKQEIQKRLNETILPPTDDNWCENKSWLSILFRKNLFIFGLNLGKEEFVLRWLLEERTKYNLKGWYAYRIGEDITNEKKTFLQRNGFEIIQVDNKDLHENVWKELNKEFIRLKAEDGKLMMARDSE